MDRRSDSIPHRNINKCLPPEVFKKIFAQVQLTGPRDIQITHVCQLWRMLLVETPEFWARMLVVCPLRHPEYIRSIPEWFKTFLDCAGAAPLSLSFPTFSKTVRDAMVHHAYHLASLSLCLSTPEALSFYTALSCGFPLLENLSLAHREPGPATATHTTLVRAIRCLDRVLPRLHTLTTPSVLLSPVLSVRTLRDLAIRACDCHECRRSSQDMTNDIVLFLNRCPFLETLSLTDSDDRLPSAEDDIPIDSSPVPLERLRNLAFFDYDPTDIHRLVRRMSLTSRTAVTVNLRLRLLDPGVEAALRDVPIFAVTDKVVVRFCTEHYDTPFSLECFREGSLRLAIYAGQRRPMIRCARPSPQAINIDALDALRLPSRASSVTTLELWEIPSWVSQDDAAISRIRRVLASFPALDVLKIHTRDELSFLRWALRPTSSGRVICPDLRALEVHWSIPAAYDSALLAADCFLLRAALRERRECERRLGVLSLTCTLARLSRCPELAREGELRRRLERIFSNVADVLRVAAYTRGDSENSK